MPSPDHRAGKQGVFWADMRDAPPEHMELAFSQRRNLLLAKYPTQKDVDSYNDNNTSGYLIQMVFDFSEDIAEREQPTKYRPKPTVSQLVFHRVRAAFFAIDFRSSAVSFSARALPPLRPPSRPRATAAGFFSLGGSASGTTVSRTCRATRTGRVPSFALPYPNQSGGCYAAKVSAIGDSKLTLYRAYWEARLFGYSPVALFA